MKRIRIIGLALVAMFAMSAVAAATASAVAPEYGRCGKIGTLGGGGKEFSDSKCLKEVGAAGKYEWQPGAVKKGFTSSGGAGLLETKGGKKVQCVTENSTGEFLTGDNKHEETVVNFTGCKSSGFPCTTTGKATEELTTNTLVGEVGFENKAKKKTALLLEPPSAGAEKGFFIKFKCIGLSVEVKTNGGRGILVNIKNDAMKKTELLKYKATKGVQKPVKWHVGEGGEETTFLESSFEKTAFEQSGQTIESTVTGEENLELNIVV